MSKLLISASFAALAAGSAADAPPYFQPEPESSLARSVSVDARIELVDYALTQMGEPVEPEDLDESLDPDAMGGEGSLQATFTDAFTRTERGRALDFVRVYDEMLVDGEDMIDGGEDGLERVRFVWNADEERYDRSVPDDEEATADNEEQLAMMRGEVDHTHLLPRADVAAGDTWEVELGAEGLMAAVVPFLSWEGGQRAFYLGLESDPDTEPELVDLMTELVDELVDELEGTVATMTYDGLRTDDDGASIAAMQIELDTSFELDLGDRMTEMVEAEMEGEDAEGAAVVIELIVELSLEGEGEFLWNTDGNHLHRLDLPLDLEIVIDGRFAVELPGLGELEFVAGDATWAGALELLQTTNG